LRKGRGLKPAALFVFSLRSSAAAFVVFKVPKFATVRDRRYKEEMMTTLAESMSQLDLLNLARSGGQTVASEFAQVITITFAMVVAIYYFLHQAGIRMKIFAFVIYTFGVLAYYGMMAMESSVTLSVQGALRAIPENMRDLPIQAYLGVRASWIAKTAQFLLNLVYWILWLGTGYLLFFWKRPLEIAPLHEKRD
jgi:hypothetical protein